MAEEKKVVPKVDKPKETILELMGLSKVKPIQGNYGIQAGMPSPELLVGLELEIENWPGYREDASFGGVTFTEDGSLRNNGIEAITFPMALKFVPTLLTAFFKKFNITDKNYSDRCSVHVHANVQNLKPDHVITLSLLYQTVERLLFSFIGHDRDNNLYCVPWYQAGLNVRFAQHMASNPFATFKKWHKYSALNLLPITTQGTVEFRHLYGTCNVQTITNWLCIIGKLFEYVNKTSLEQTKESIINMNTVSNYREWLYSVFGEFTDLLMTANNYQGELARGVVDTKLMLADHKEVQAPQFFNIDDMAEEIALPRIRDVFAPEYGNAIPRAGVRR